MRTLTFTAIFTSCVLLLNAGCRHAEPLGDPAMLSEPSSPGGPATSVFRETETVASSDWRVAQRIETITQPQPRLIADNLTAVQSWFTIATLPEGVLTPDREYLVEIAYEGFETGDPGAFAYALARAPSYGTTADEWMRWRPAQQGEAGKISFRIPTPKAPGVTLALALHGKSRIVVTSVSVRQAEPTEWPEANASLAFPTDARPARLPENFNIDLPAPASPRRATVWELLPDTPPSETITQRMLQRAIDASRAAGVTTLELPPAVYQMDAKSALRIEGRTDFTIEGNGATLVFSSIASEDHYGLTARQNHRLAIRNLKIDWDHKTRPLASLGRLVEIRDGGKALLFDLLDDGHQTVDPRVLVARNINPLDETDRAYTHGFSSNEPAVDVRRQDDGRYLFQFAKPLPLDAGRLYILRHYTYQRHAMSLSDNTHLTLEDVDILGFPGSGIQVSGRQHHWQMIRCNIAPADGEAGLISTSADGLHIRQSLGYMKLVDCSFLRTGDDAINLHDNVSYGIEPIDSRTFVALNVFAWRNPFDAGDTLEFLDTQLVPTGISAVVANAEFLPDGRCRISLANDLPSPPPTDAIIVNRAYNSDHYIIQNCRFGWSRARGLVLRNGEGLVENCDFERTQAAAIKLHVDIERRWAEGVGASNVTFRNNRFRSVNPSAWHGGAAIYIDAEVPAGFAASAAFSAVTIEGNTFAEALGPALVSRSATGLLFRGNQLDAHPAVTPAEAYFQPGATIVTGAVKESGVTGGKITPNQK